MHTSSTDIPTAQHPPGVIAQGIELGGSAGCLGSSVYLGLYLLLPILGTLAGLWTTDSSGAILGGMFFFGMTLIVGSVIGVLPATILGVITGALIGACQRALGQQLTLMRARWLGALLCGILAALLHAGVWWWRVFTPDYMLMYVLLLGIPSVVYLGLGAWLSGRLFEETQAAQADAVANPSARSA